MDGIRAMNGQTTSAERSEGPVGPESAKAMYRHMLAGWVMDSLELRRRGLDRPTRRDGQGVPLGPAVWVRRAA